jgi:RNA polymerase sigma-70 factor, ECF subfamily
LLTIAEIFRREHGRAVAVLARQLGDLSLAEEAVQDAFTKAITHWAAEGIPPSPAGWIITTARNGAIDRLRREATRDVRQQAAMQLLEDEKVEEHDVRDDTLRLIFTCCHPALATEAQLALTLRLLGGLSTAEIARAFLVPEATLAQRISRAKAKIRAAGIPYRIPQAEDLPARLRSVLAVVYLLFNEGYSATAGENLQRHDLVDEAIRLARLLQELIPQDLEIMGLLALLLLVDSRRDARVDEHGGLLTLQEQDRTRWRRDRIDEGQALVRLCLAANRPGPYQIQAAINAVHSDAGTAADTDWRQVLALYDLLMTVNPTPVVALNRAVAVAEIEGPGKALRLVDELGLERYYLWHAVKADLLRRLGNAQESALSYFAAIGCCDNLMEKEFLERKRVQAVDAANFGL